MQRIRFDLKQLGLYAVVCLLSGLLVIGCKKDDSTVAVQQMDAQATEDAAAAIGAAVAVNNGGAFDQVADVMDVAASVGLYGTANRSISSTVSTDSVSKSYDDASGWWTVTIDRQRGNQTGLYYSNYHRVYKYQFLKNDGSFQKYYLVGTDTAYSIKHQIVSGSGTVVTPRVDNKLLSVDGAWTATNTNTPTVTINSTAPYNRTASDTVIWTMRNAQRTLNSSLTLNFANVTGARGSGLNWHKKTSGTVTGTYHATVTFQKGDTYTEKTIDRTFTITLGGVKPVVKIGGLTYLIDAETGEVAAP